MEYCFPFLRRKRFSLNGCAARGLGPCQAFQSLPLWIQEDIMSLLLSLHTLEPCTDDMQTELVLNSMLCKTLGRKSIFQFDHSLARMPLASFSPLEFSLPRELSM